jgi:hypothetical protein
MMARKQINVMTGIMVAPPIFKACDLFTFFKTENISGMIKIKVIESSLEIRDKNIAVPPINRYLFSHFFKYSSN